MKTKKCLRVFLCAALFLSGSVMLLAQDDEAVFARIGFWDVKRTHWKSVVAGFEKNTVPVLEKLFNEGSLMEWGMDENVVHQPEGYTHSVWWVAKDLAGLENVLAAMDEASDRLGESEQAQNVADLTDSLIKHRDVVVRSLEYASRPSRLDSGYVFTNHVQVAEGKGRDYLELWRKYSKPVYEQLLADGVIASYGLDVEAVHTDHPAWRTTWYVIPNLADDGKVDAALGAAWEKRSEEERDAIQAAFREATVYGSHRDGMNKVIHYVCK